MKYRPFYASSRKPDLTDRQKQVMELVCCGKSDPQIAGILHISVNTAKNHLRGVRRKLCAENRVLAAVKYTKLKG